MADLSFTVNLAWTGTGRAGKGSAALSTNQTVTYSGPDTMGGKGEGTSPEELLIAGVSSCYSGTLFGVLSREGLPVAEVKIRAVGTVTGYPLEAKFAELCVHPTIYGGDITREGEYHRLAEVARERCFIGKTIAGNVTYRVGEVIVIPESE